MRKCSLEHTRTSRAVLLSPNITKLAVHRERFVLLSFGGNLGIVLQNSWNLLGEWEEFSPSDMFLLLGSKFIFLWSWDFIFWNSCLKAHVFYLFSVLWITQCLDHLGTALCSCMFLLSSLSADAYPTDFTVVPTESCPVGSSSTIIVNERNREHDKQEAWLLMELQKLRRQIEASEIQMVQRAPLGVDQGAMHDFSVRIKDLEVTVDVWASQVQYDSVLQFCSWSSGKDTHPVQKILSWKLTIMIWIKIYLLSRKSWLLNFRNQILPGKEYRKTDVRWLWIHVKPHPE